MFSIPPKAAVDKLKPGNLVSILIDFINKTTRAPQAEVVWCVVMQRTNSKLVVAVWPDPPLRKVAHHGLQAKMLLNITLRHVLDIAFEPTIVKRPLQIV